MLNRHSGWWIGKRWAWNHGDQVEAIVIRPDGKWESEVKQGKWELRDGDDYTDAKKIEWVRIIGLKESRVMVLPGCCHVQAHNI